jgi:hypothetical protein
MQQFRVAVATLSQDTKVRVYTPSDGELPAHKVDDRFFNDNPKRRVAIRQSLPGELENGHELAERCGLGTLYAQRPPLWMMVLSSGNGKYRVFPAYRGQHFFPVVQAYQGTFAKCSNDAACLELFDECDLRGGMDAEAWIAWQSRWTEAFKQYAVAQQVALQSCERVN